MFTSPPPSQGALGRGSSRPRGRHSTFEASFGRFFGSSIFDWFFDAILHRFGLPKWSPNRPKIVKKSDFFVDWRWKRFLQVSSCFLSSFLHRLRDLRTSISKRPYSTFWGFFAFPKIASRTTSKWFLTSQRLQKTLKNPPKVLPEAFKKQHRKKKRFFIVFFHQKYPPRGP